MVKVAFDVFNYGTRDDAMYFVNRRDVHFRGLNWNFKHTFNNVKHHLLNMLSYRDKFDEDDRHLIYMAILRYGSPNQVEHLFSIDEFKRTNTQDVFNHGLRSNHYEVIQMTLRHSDAEITDKSFVKMINARDSLTLMIVCEDPRIDDMDSKITLFIKAVDAGNIRMMIYMTQCRGVDPSARNNLAIVRSAMRDDDYTRNVARYLLAYPNVDPFVDRNRAIYKALRAKNFNTVMVFLNHKRIIDTLNPRLLIPYREQDKRIDSWLKCKNIGEYMMTYRDIFSSHQDVIPS
jgi:hypothetical protein